MKAFIFLGRLPERQHLPPHLLPPPPPSRDRPRTPFKLRLEVTTRKVARPGPAATPDRRGSPRMPLGVRAPDNAARYLVERAEQVSPFVALVRGPQLGAAEASARARGAAATAAAAATTTTRAAATAATAATGTCPGYAHRSRGQCLSSSPRPRLFGPRRDND